jgi:HAD superfamily hydrolase (TIGR01509 family)
VWAWLQRLHAQDIPQAIVSSAPRDNITVVLAALGASDLFQALISGDDVAQGKPDPASFLLAARQLGMPPTACVVIEDAPAGVEAARRAGMACLAVTTSHAREHLDADLVVDALVDLPVDTLEQLVRR